MYLDLKQLRDREPLISENVHDLGNLRIWNYTPKCQYERAWDEYTSICRGLITDCHGKVVARPFPKFFNVGETPETEIENLPLEVPEIYEKMDGSLGILYFIADKPYIATRGSFSSDQARWATQWIQERSSRFDFKEGYTYLFEIIYPENRIVVDYGGVSALVLLAVINIETGSELDVVEEGARLGLGTPKKYEGSLPKMLKHAETMPGNEEGFVCRYSNGFRVKIKGTEYVRLHRLITGFSSKSIWECLMNGQNIEEMLERVPDEFYQWVQKTKRELEAQYFEIEDLAKEDYRTVIKELGDGWSRKELALAFQKCEYPSLLFSIFDAKDYKTQIWRMLKPKYELPFKKDDDA